MPHSIKRLLEVDEEVVDVLMLAVLFAQDSKVEDLFCGAPSTAKSSLLFRYDLCLRFQSVQNDLQHHFACMADKADGSVILAELQVSFLGKGDDE